MPTSTPTGGSADTPIETPVGDLQNTPPVSPAGAPAVAPAVAPAPKDLSPDIAERAPRQPFNVRSAPPAKESLREQKKARARSLILSCAQELINTEGYAETKMRDVAAAAKMSYQTLYNYFPTKGLILQELLTQDLSKLQSGTSDTLRSAQPLANKLRELAKDYIDAVAPNERHLWKEVCAELLKVTSHHSCFLALLDEQAMSKFRDLLSSAQDNGELDPHIDSDTLAEVLYSLLDATLMRYLVNESLSRPSILRTISAQIRLTVTPYLR